MRLKLIMDCNPGAVLPYNYNYQLVHIIRRAIHQVNPAGSGLGKCFNLYTFSQLYFEKYAIGKEGILNQGERVHWYVTSPRIIFLETLLRGMKNIRSLQLGDSTLWVQGAEVLGDPDIKDKMEFSCMSPISIACAGSSKDARPRYGRIEDRDFSEKLRQDLISKYYKVYDALPSDENLHFEFNKTYIKNKARVTRLVDFNGVKILGYMVPFTVTGNPELIQLGYQLGFGHKNSCGFGMVKIWYSQQRQDEAG